MTLRVFVTVPLLAQIMFNKAVLDTMHFPFPMFLTSWHMFLATVMTQIMSRTTNMLPGVTEVRTSITDGNYSTN
jgi:hypothetical protein